MQSKRVVPTTKLFDLVVAMHRHLRTFGLVCTPPVLRVALALPFFRSGQTRWDGFHLAFATPFFFEEVFKLHVLGRVFDMPAPDVTAYVVAVAEIVLPVLLFLGLATRLAALGLLIMTAVIQLVVPDGWVNFHLYWAALALAILAVGAGKFSVDFLLAFWMRRRIVSRNTMQTKFITSPGRP